MGSSRRSTLDNGETTTPGDQIELKDVLTSHNTAEKGSEAALDNGSNEVSYPGGLSLAVIFLGLFFTAFCVGLDRSIVATAVPQITSDFDSLDDVAWYGSAYLMTTCCLQLLFGKLYAVFLIKWVFLAGLLIFEVGSIICAVAPSSAVLIVGRAVAGMGGAGLVSGALIILARSVPLHNRPKYAGAMGGAVGVAQVIAPLLGGVFTDKLTWRWCFWINLPLGGITFFVVLFLVNIPVDPGAEKKRGPRGFLEIFDLVGTLLLIPWVICLLFALEWGGVKYAWGSWRIILLLVLFGVLFLAWAFVQIRQGDKATVPPRIIKQRSMASGLWFMFCVFSSFFIVTYYVPIWFQAVRNDSAYHSGLNYLATSAAMSITVISAGFLTSRIGYYVPQMIAGAVLTSVGTGLVYTYDVDTSDGFWIGSLIVVGIGIGIGAQQPVMAAQTVFKGADIALSTSALMFTQTLAGTVFLTVAQSVFQSQIVRQVSKLAPGVDVQDVVNAGASELWEVVGKKYPKEFPEVLKAYNGALQRVFLIAVVLSCFMVFGVVGMEWISVKKEKKSEKK